MRKPWLSWLLVILLILMVVWLGWRYQQAHQELVALRQQVANREANVKIIDFTAFFITKVLKADREVDVDTRFELERMVRELQNQEILDSWKRFINVQTEPEAQREVKNFLEVLVKNIKVS